MAILSMTEIKVATGCSVRLLRMQEVVGRAIALLEAADRELGQTQEGARSSIARATSILLAEVGHAAQLCGSRGGTAALLPWQTRRVLEYIDAHLGRSLKVAELSALLSRTEAHFSRMFKGAFGVSPHAYILRRRIELASRLMVESTTPLTEIALQCGFNDQAHLSKRFRQQTGATPAAWRREQSSNDALTAKQPRVQRPSPRSQHGQCHGESCIDSGCGTQLLTQTHDADLERRCGNGSDGRPQADPEQDGDCDNRTADEQSCCLRQIGDEVRHGECGESGGRAQNQQPDSRPRTGEG